MILFACTFDYVSRLSQKYSFSVLFCSHLIHTWAVSALGVQNPRPWASGSVFSNVSRFEAVYGHSFSISREVLIL